MFNEQYFKCVKHDVVTLRDWTHRYNGLGEVVFFLANNVHWTESTIMFSCVSRKNPKSVFFETHQLCTLICYFMVTGLDHHPDSNRIQIRKVVNKMMISYNSGKCCTFLSWFTPWFGKSNKLMQPRTSGLWKTNAKQD